MNCQKCGAAMNEEARFCPQCGAGSDGQPSSEFAAGMHQYFHYQRDQLRKEQEAKDARSAAFYANAEFERLKKRRTSCTIAGAIAALTGISLTAIPLMASASSPDQFLSVIPLAIILGPFFFFAPFGFMPIKDFISNHGAIIVFAWIFVLIVFYLVIVFCMFAGIPYFFYLQSKIKAAQRDAELLQNRADVMVANFREG
ncbi:hypothetical protein C1879_03240 [Paraeggerthella hongkongensis]|jgi:hypothetical protein|uniref:zinc ribbon domain-containing protein n=1 Tax=Paraeggerthella sp. TaxID=2897350 RepID=UPI000DF76B55|nr:hypothetical protein C1879_03240 [Paraeggerthella hongkongensis]